MIKRIAITIICLMSPSLALAAVDLPWSTTYDCTPWAYGGTLECDGLVQGLPSELYGGPCFPEEIEIAANNPTGGGGGGQTHPVCSDQDNTSSSGGGTILYFNDPQPELWVRAYIKFEAGLTWSTLGPTIKLFYLYRERGEYPAAIPKFEYWNEFGIYGLSGQPDVASDIKFGNAGWQTVMSGDVSDGEWHYFEFHLRADTDSTDGVVEVWIDDLPVQSETSADLGFYASGYAGVGWTSMTIASNLRHLATTTRQDIYYDDISVSSTGRIGKLFIGGFADTVTAYSLLDGSVIPYKLTTE